MIAKNVLYYGDGQPLPSRIPLQAGPLQLFFYNGDLRHICYGEQEVLRRVYVAVRDRNWGTVAPQISNLQIDEGQRDFRITFNVICQQDEIDFGWQGQIKGTSEGTITFSMMGEAFSIFWRNRIGFCVLHPIRECAGQPCQVEHTDGGVTQAAFPKFISPHQPFKNIRAICHQIGPGLRARLVLEGETFEMEDQRNWTDASFKIYGTPLDESFPVLVRKGECFQQRVRLSLEGSGEPDTRMPDPSKVVKISLQADPDESDNTGPRFPLPTIGLSLASHGQTLKPDEIERLQGLHLAHLRADLRLNREAWRAALRRGVDEANALDCRLEMALHLTDNAASELQALLTALGEIQPKVARWIIFHQNEPSTNPKWVRLARKILTAYDPSIPIGCGADSNFTELNRDPPDAKDVDFLAYATNPQVHAFDNLSLVENLAGLGETVTSARRIAAGKSIVVSPVTFKPRFNSVATCAMDQPDPNQLLPQVDRRQMSLFGAGWALGSIKYLAEKGAKSATFFETSGWRGVMERQAGSPLPEKFRSIPGAVFPLFHIFADLGEFTGGQVVPSRSSAPLKVETLTVRKGGQLRVLVANLVKASTKILIEKLPDWVEVKTLDESSYLAAVQSPTRFHRQPGAILESVDGSLELSMKPYAIVRIEPRGA
jgi:hypothetical protein